MIFPLFFSFLFHHFPIVINDVFLDSWSLWFLNCFPFNFEDNFHCPRNCLNVFRWISTMTNWILLKWQKTAFLNIFRWKLTIFSNNFPNKFSIWCLHETHSSHVNIFSRKSARQLFLLTAELYNSSSWCREITHTEINR